MKTDLSGYTPNVEAIAGYEPDLVVIVGRRPTLERPARGARPDRVGRRRRRHVRRGLRPDRAARRGDRPRRRGRRARRRRCRPTSPPLAADVPTSEAPLTFFHELDDTATAPTRTRSSARSTSCSGSAQHRRRAPTTRAATRSSTPRPSSRPNPDLIFLADTKCCGQSLETRRRPRRAGPTSPPSRTATSSPWTTTSPRAGARASSTTPSRSTMLVQQAVVPAG